jgi:Asp-tRNA(Asn)/Glu-tRNA(Gln) amidotransferase C subunit
MEITLDALKQVTRLAGFEWEDAELEALRPLVARTLDMLARLDAVDLGATEPTTQYRIL